MKHPPGIRGRPSSKCRGGRRWLNRTNKLPNSGSGRPPTAGRSPFESQESRDARRTAAHAPISGCQLDRGVCWIEGRVDASLHAQPAQPAQPARARRNLPIWRSSHVRASNNSTVLDMDANDPAVVARAGATALVRTTAERGFFQVRGDRKKKALRAGAAFRQFSGALRPTTHGCGIRLARGWLLARART